MSTMVPAPVAPMSSTRTISAARPPPSSCLRFVNSYFEYDIGYIGVNSITRQILSAKSHANGVNPDRNTRADR